MNLSEPFIRRPVAATLLTIGVTLSGLVAFQLLPVAPLPNVEFPTIFVQASLPGASPETMAATVATPLERSLSRIAGVTEMTSTSSLGSTRIVLQFDLNRDIDGAARDVQAAINAARSLLPSGLPSNPFYRKANPANAPAMILALTSDSMTQGQVYDVAATLLAQKLAQVEGVGQVTIGGSSLPAVRVELNPQALNRLGIALEDVRAAISAANPNRPKGAIEDDTRHWQVTANDQAKKAADYLPIIVSWRNGAAVRLSDVADVVDSVQDVRNAGAVNGKPAVVLLIGLQAGANIIATVDRVSAMVPALRASIPAAIDLNVVMERTSTIRASLREVGRTLAISVALVIMVVFVFLRNARAALIPTVAVPVSLIGTFGVMYLCGYSIDNFSLMALTIATGFVVDDAIVVVENVSRHLEKGLSPMQAALKGAREVGFTVLSMSVSLIAVFIPILLMGGIVGRLFREFSVVLSTAILVSLAVSLTTTPMMCSRLLRHQPEGARGRFYRWSERGFAVVLGWYEVSLAWALRHGRIVMLALAGTVALNVWLYITIPKGFFPQQDTGRVVGFIQADQGISFQAMQKKLATFMQIVKDDPAVLNVTGFTGGGQRNSGQMFVALKPRKERAETADQVIARLRGKLAKEPGASLFLQSVQDVRAGGREGAAQYQYTLQADDLNELRLWEQRLRNALTEIPEITDVSTDAQDKGLQTSLAFDRESASRLGLTMRQIDTTLANAFSQRQVSTIYNPLNQYKVVMEVAPSHWQSPESLKDVYVMTPGREAVPLAAFSSFGPTNTPLRVNHQGQFAASTISFNLAPGVSLGEAGTAIKAAMDRIGVPTSVQGSFQGTAKLFQSTGDSQLFLILAALLTVYIVLGVLYESYIHPLTILSTLPSAGVGALLALMAFNTEFSLIALIGVILLIGIVKKNAILMIDFALDAERTRNLSSRDAIFEACSLRFRPIMMTTLAAMLGALPLALGSGDGAELRVPLGISIVGGLLVSQVLTLYTTPVVYLYLDRFRLWCLRRFRGRSAPIAVPERAATTS
jgi:multidrug efflux pump